MAIQVKTTNLNGLAALQKLGVATELCASLQPAGVDVKLTATHFQFTKGGAATAVPVKLEHLQKLNAGTLPMAEKIKMANELTKAIVALQTGQISEQLVAAGSHTGGMAALPKMPGSPVVQPTTQVMVPGSPETVSTAELMAQKAAAKLQQHAENYGVSPEKFNDGGLKGPLLPPIGMIAKGGGAVKEWEPFPKKDLMTATPVKLRDATRLYQPVYGTSSGSRYFMVAANKDLRIAARLETGTLSVRVEGPNWKKHLTAITECGISADAKKGEHASMHLAVGSDPMVARKTLGAILAGLGIELETPIPDLKTIYG